MLNLTGGSLVMRGYKDTSPIIPTQEECKVIFVQLQCGENSLVSKYWAIKINHFKVE